MDSQCFRKMVIIKSDSKLFVEARKQDYNPSLFVGHGLAPTKSDPTQNMRTYTSTSYGP